MTQLLEQAFRHASKLAPQEQDALARWLLEEFDAEHRWDLALGASDGSS
jgi:hypothetical protein